MIAVDPSPSRTTMRSERDSLGEVDVPVGAYFGAQTVRACSNFPISGVSIGQFPSLIKALLLVKKAAASANARLGDLSQEKANAILAACDDLMQDYQADWFPIDVFQGGAGTSTNMNVNEVVANRALERMGHAPGSYERLHPNNDVNLAQSTNDVYPTAIRLAILLSLPTLRNELEDLASAFESKALEFADILKVGRTQLQDAVPMTLGQEFMAFAVTVREDVQRLDDAAGLLREINLGGTAIGTGITADPGYQAIAVAELSRLSELPLTSASNLVEASWDTGAFVAFSGVLKRVAVKLSKIASDLRLLSSGPRAGFGEIRLPAIQPGSSIMPGKVNPVIPEVVNQVAYQVIGADLVVTLAAESGQLQLNAFEPVIVFNVLQSLSLLRNAVSTLRCNCVAGIQADEGRCWSNLEAGTALATALTPIIGYEKAAELAKRVLETNNGIRELLAQDAELDPALIDEILDPAAMTKPFRFRPLSSERC